MYWRCDMDYITTKEAAERWNITDRRVLQYCNNGRITGAKKMGNTWLIPQTANKPADKRYKANKSIKQKGVTNS